MASGQIVLAWDDHERVIAALAAGYGYKERDWNPPTDPTTEVGEMVPNPESAEDFVKRRLLEGIRSQVQRQEGELAAKAARETAVTAAQAEIGFASAAGADGAVLDPKPLKPTGPGQLGPGKVAPGKVGPA